MRDQTPEQLASALVQYVTQVLVPLGQAYPNQGVAPDIRKLTAMFARYKNMPELNDMMVDVGPQQEQEGRHGSEPRQAAVTTRNIVRTSQSGGTNGGVEQARAMQLIGAANKNQRDAAQGVG